MTFPLFKYHPDPIASGSVAESETKCLCCERKTGFIYKGPVHAEDTLENKICPWCIADGSAAEKFEAVFTDEEGIGADELGVETQEKLARRTPGFDGRKRGRWLACCNDAAAYLGAMGREELESLGPLVVEAVRMELGLQGAEWVNFFGSLHKDHGPTAYVFQCLHCSAIKAYADRA